MTATFDIMSLVGGLATALTSLSYLPQVRKAWPRASTGDISLKMLVALTGGLLLWIIYGALQRDWILVFSNCVGATLAAIVLGCKIRDVRAGN
ncbi:MAG: SemiSWEET family transporter [Hyphomicrobiales bacterium]|nr:SemiSWEET family transporter [Hyphomicrobiales bacterium]